MEEILLYKANSIINCLANILLFWQGLVFYFEFIKRDKEEHLQPKIFNRRINKHIVSFYLGTIRVGIALLLIGSLYRTILDFGYVFFEVNKVGISAIPALMRNLGNGILLVFLVDNYKNKKANAKKGIT